MGYKSRVSLLSAWVGATLSLIVLCNSSPGDWYGNGFWEDVATCPGEEAGLCLFSAHSWHLSFSHMTNKEFKC